MGILRSCGFESLTIIYRESMLDCYEIGSMKTELLGTQMFVLCHGFWSEALNLSQTLVSSRCSLVVAAATAEPPNNIDSG